MFDIGFQELIIIFIVALLVFGPEKLPEVGRTLAKWIIEIRKGIQTAKIQMDNEISEIEKSASTTATESKGDTSEQKSDPVDRKEEA